MTDELKWYDASDDTHWVGKWVWIRTIDGCTFFGFALKHHERLKDNYIMWESVVAVCPVEIPDPPEYIEPRRPLKFTVEWLPYPETDIPEDWELVCCSSQDTPSVPTTVVKREDICLLVNIKWVAKRT